MGQLQSSMKASGRCGEPGPATLIDCSSKTKKRGARVPQIHHQKGKRERIGKTNFPFITGSGKEQIPGEFWGSSERKELGDRFLPRKLFSLGLPEAVATRGHQAHTESSLSP